jgi:DNA (cytosine-5)-methyltransferase 1
VRRPRLLDLFCGAGGAAMGYHRAGFDVVGVDIEPQPHYPFAFIEDDALAMLKYSASFVEDFDAIHASPPCQAYSTATPDKSVHADLYEPTRALLESTGLPWVIENVPGAPYRQGIVLCGSMFGLRVRRHRNFEASWLMLSPGCDHRTQGTPLGIYGDGGPGRSTRPSGGGGTKAARRDFADLMDMPWATPAEIVQAIPPAYTEFIGAQLLRHVVGAST